MATTVPWSSSLEPDELVTVTQSRVPPDVIANVIMAVPSIFRDAAQDG